MKEDLIDIEGIKILVDKFYERIRIDDLLGPIFESKLHGNWDKHLSKMYDFWNTILFSKGSYKGSPFEQHRELPVHKEHFDRWLSLFEETIDQYFEGKNAKEALLRAKTIGWTFLSKIEHLRHDQSS